MKDNELFQTTKRRGFLATIAGGAAALGLAAVSAPMNLLGQQKPKSTQANGQKPMTALHPADAWFNKVKGTHRVVYDSTEPNEIFAFAWPKVFLLTNAATGSPASDCGVVVVLRHASIGYAFNDNMWAKYGFGEMFKAIDLGPAFQAPDKEKAAYSRNPFWSAKPGDFKIPGIGPVDIGIADLMKDGVMFCVCNAAITVYSAVVADKMGAKPEEIKNIWTENLIPGIEIVPSGVWALGRAQEHGCKYIFAG